MKSREHGRRKNILGTESNRLRGSWVVPGIRHSKVPVKRSRLRGEGREAIPGQRVMGESFALILKNEGS